MFWFCFVYFVPNKLLHIVDQRFLGKFSVKTARNSQTLEQLPLSLDIGRDRNVKVLFSISLNWGIKYFYDQIPFV